MEKMDFGVYATPKELANYLVKCTELILARETLGKQSLHSEGVKVIDPGCGTGTFLEELVRNYALSGSKEKCLATWVGIEILSVPYGLAQMRLDSLKSELKIGLKPTVLMGNSLSDPVVQGTTPSSIQTLSKQAESLNAEFKDVIKAAKVPITVVLGNPPVSDKGFNMGKSFKHIENALNDFRPPASMRRNRMNVLKPLQNDCIKFLRWASLKIEQSNGGIGAYVMPSSVLGDLSYKYLRGYLKRNYDEIYILNIDQDLRQKGTKTESLFATQQGRSAIIFVKFLQKSERSGSGAKLFYYDLNHIAKSKADKINWLIQESGCGTPLRSFVEFESIGELNPFFSTETKNHVSLALKEYGEFWPLDKIFLHHVSGIKTGCTGLLVHQDKNRLGALLRDYADDTISDDELTRRYFKGQAKKGAYQYGSKRVIMARHLKKGIRLSNIREYQFRPFVQGFIYYDPEIMKETDGGRPRPELDLIFSASNQGSIGLGVAQNPSQLSSTMDPFVCAVHSLPDNDLVRRGNAYIFTTDFPNAAGQLIHNINSQLGDYLRSMIDTQDLKITAEALVYYSYAVFNSVEYLRKYKDVIYHNIAAGFVRVPLTLDKSIFKDVMGIGKDLFNASLGLLPSKATFSFTGDLPVDIDAFKIRERLIIGIKANREVFRVTLKDGNALNYMTGGYNALEEWLKRRTVHYLHRQFESGDLDNLSRIINGIEIHLLLQPRLSTCIESLLSSPVLKYR
jgi:predicted helicase